MEKDTAIDSQIEKGFGKSTKLFLLFCPTVRMFWFLISLGFFHLFNLFHFGLPWKKLASSIW